jgi:hypothetical protein
MNRLLELSTSLVLDSKTKKNILGDLATGNTKIKDVVVKNVVLMTDTPLKGLWFRGSVLKEGFKLFNNVSAIAPFHVWENLVPAYEYGFLSDAWYDTKAKALVADVHINLPRLRALSLKIYTDLINGRPINGSAHVKCTILEIKSGKHNGVQYDTIVKKIDRVVHYALLSHEVGVCSVYDGCGINPVKDLQVSIKNSSKELILDMNKEELSNLIAETVMKTVETLQKNTETLTVSEEIVTEVEETTPEEKTEGVFSLTQCQYTTLLNRVETLEQSLSEVNESNKILRASLAKEVKGSNKTASQKANWL